VAAKAWIASIFASFSPNSAPAADRQAQAAPTGVEAQARNEADAAGEAQRHLTSSDRVLNQTRETPC
jgi:hypothetical protein